MKPSSKTYKINEFFFSLQGEGVLAGTPSLFLRFSDCNLRCQKEREGFDCDTEFVSGRNLSLDKIVGELKGLSTSCRFVILTGGEPSLQVDEALIDRLHSEGFKLAIETNGTKEVSQKIDWITVSPKTAEHTLRQKFAHELKYVRAYGQALPETRIEALHYLISPAFEGDFVSEKNLQWCIGLVKENPKWRLSVQLHKFLKIR